MTTKTSICWNCKNGRADRCAWIDKKEQVWEKASKRMCRLEKERGYLALWTVKKCKHFEPGNQNHQNQRRKTLQLEPPEERRGRRPIYTPEEDALILSLRKKGVPCGAIADRMGRSLGAIYGRIARLRKMGEVEQDDEGARIAATKLA